MKTSLVTLAGAALLLCGCSVMNFQNGSVEPDGRPIEKWHHNVAYSLFEISPPLEMKTLCAATGKWSMITTKETFVTGLAGGADNALTSALTGVGIDVWDPQMVEYTCGK